MRTILAGGAGLLALAAAAPVLGQPGAAVPGVIVTAPTPFPNASIDLTRTPLAVSVLTGADLARTGTPDLLRALEQMAPGVQLDSASGNPDQVTLIYRGFQASPLQGAGQGLAVYVNGVRANQPFGDTVDWDLIPEAAVDQATLTGSDPAFGLNALAGALSIRLKSAFTWQGAAGAVEGGAFGATRGEAEAAQRLGDLGLYVAAAARHEDGWRDLQSSDVQNLFTDLGWRRGSGEAHLGLRLAQSLLNGPGSSPVELLAVDPAAQFTAPNQVRNAAAGLNLSAQYAPRRTASLQAIAHLDYFQQRVFNGNAPNDGPCPNDPSLLCSDGGPSTTHGGQPIPAFLGPDPLSYSELDLQTTRTVGYGAALQASAAPLIAGQMHHLLAGLSFDGAQTRFDGASRIGGIAPESRVFVGPGVIIDEPGVSSPVSLFVRDAYGGLYVSDGWDLTPKLSLSLSGRLNLARIDLFDRNGGDLGGRHRFDRFNPAIGVSWRPTPWLGLYAGYAEANRAPTPAELSCANPKQSCSLANFFVGDPDLKQVVARTLEAGARGSIRGLRYSLALYRSELDDDIGFVNSQTLGRAFFANIGRTERLGLDLDMHYETRRWSLSAAYAHVEATYRTGFVEAAGENPAATTGVLTIRPGDRLPGTPRNSGKIAVTYRPGPALSLGATLVARDGSPLFGDEANLTPDLPGYVRLDLDAAWRLSPHAELFVRIENATDARYATFGTFSPTDAVRLVQAPGASNPRSLSPAAPIGAFGGLRARF